MAGAIVAEQHHERERQELPRPGRGLPRDLAAQKRLAEVEAPRESTSVIGQAAAESCPTAL